MPVDTTFDAHGEGLSVWEEVTECMLIRLVHHLCAVQALLALALLREKVVATVAVELQSAATRLPDAFLCAAVGLELRHVAAQSRTDLGGCKAKI
jgi:hypothetical protein